jgi:hypothetical protein
MLRNTLRSSSLPLPSLHRSETHNLPYREFFSATVTRYNLGKVGTFVVAIVSKFATRNFRFQCFLVANPAGSIPVIVV